MIGYCRVSSKGQEDNTSLEAQEERIRHWCLANGHDLPIVLSGVESGANLERDSFYRALRMLICDNCEIGAIPKRTHDLIVNLEQSCNCGGNSSYDGLIAYDLDRVGRSARDVLWLGFDFINKRNKVLVVLNGVGKCDLTTAHGKMIFGMLAVQAQFYRDSLLERSSAGRKRRAQDNEYVCGRPPYGLRRVGPRKLEAIPEEMAILDEIHIMVSLGLSYAAIADGLNKQRKYKRNNNPWTSGAVYNILKEDSIRTWFMRGRNYNYVRDGAGF